jgi:hypothetical protein
MDMISTTISLTPRNWIRSDVNTFGNIPPQMLVIPRYLWKKLGCPQNIEEYWEKYNQCKLKICPHCGGNIEHKL